ncbi:MAG: hypothetical protein JWP87_5623 [Labilithrix sp.]|nr:hypothetical protein [Labilithrix sp.]
MRSIFPPRIASVLLVAGAATVVLVACGPSAHERASSPSDDDNFSTARAEPRSRPENVDTQADLQTQRAGWTAQCAANDCAALVAECRSVANRRADADRRSACEKAIAEVVRTAPGAALDAVRVLASEDRERYRELGKLSRGADPVIAARAARVLCAELAEPEWAVDDDLLNGDAYDLAHDRGRACETLGGKLVSGEGVDKDVAKALAARRLACELGKKTDPTETCDGLAAFVDYEVPKLDPILAAPALRGRCEGEKQARSCLALADLLIGPDGAPQVSKTTAKEAAALGERACTLDAESCNAWFLLYRVSKSDPDAALASAKWFWDHKSPVNVQGATTYPLFVRDGIGIKKDPAKAAAMFREACEMTSARWSWAACGLYASLMKEGPEKQEMKGRADARKQAQLSSDNARVAAESDANKARYMASFTAQDQARDARQKAQRDRETAEDRAKAEREAALSAAQKREARRAEEAAIQAADARSRAAAAERRRTAQAIAGTVQQLSDTVAGAASKPPSSMPSVSTSAGAAAPRNNAAATSALPARACAGNPQPDGEACAKYCDCQSSQWTDKEVVRDGCVGGVCGAKNGTDCGPRAGRGERPVVCIPGQGTCQGHGNSTKDRARYLAEKGVGRCQYGVFQDAPPSTP